MAEDTKTEVKAEKKKTVKVQVKRPFRYPLMREGLSKEDSLKLQDSQKVVDEGKVIEVSEDEAKELCDKALLGHYDGVGETFANNMKPAKVYRAVRV